VPNIGPAEILVILVVALLVFGPDKLPDIGKQVGRAVREFRKVQATLRDEVRDVLEPRPTPAAAAAPHPPQLPPVAEPAADSMTAEGAAADQGTPPSGDPPGATPSAHEPAGPEGPAPERST